MVVFPFFHRIIGVFIFRYERKLKAHFLLAARARSQKRTNNK